MDICLPDVYETITLCARSKYVGHSTVVRDANEVATLGIFRHKAKAIFSGDRKPSVMRRKAGSVKQPDQVCYVRFVGVLIGEEIKECPCFLHAVLRRDLGILPYVPATSGLDSVGIIEQYIVFRKVQIICCKFVPVGKEEAAIAHIIVIAVTPWGKIIARASNNVHYETIAFNSLGLHLASRYHRFHSRIVGVRSPGC